MRIEPPTAEDVDAIVDQWVALASEQREHGTHVLPERNRAAIRESVHRWVVTGDALVAREDAGDDEATIAGFVAFERRHSGFETDADRGVVTNLYVRPDRRDRGIGAELLSAAERELAEMGAGTVAIEAMADNEAARRFYRRRGYELHRVELEKNVEDRE